ncbi:hypothetical protein HK096_009988, partial [Nowakowskiella sp. JEL0078]
MGDEQVREIQTNETLLHLQNLLPQISEHSADDSEKSIPLGLRFTRPVSKLFESNQYYRLFLAELFGTFLLVWFGIGSVSSGVIAGALKGLWQVATVWGFGVAIAIFVTAPISGAHLNPAVSIATALFNSNFSWFKCLIYIIAQFLGSILAGLVNYGMYGAAIVRFERLHGIIRGEAGSERSAMVFGEYFPNPDVFQATGNETQSSIDELVSPLGALCAELLGTAIIVLVIFALTDKCNKTILKGMEPFFIGFCVSVNISLLAPLSQAGFNPARDFGPRLVSYFLGWGAVAIPGPRNGFWVFIVGPIIGAILGATFFEPPQFLKMVAICASALVLFATLLVTNSLPTPEESLSAAKHNCYADVVLQANTARRLRKRQVESKGDAFSYEGATGPAYWADLDPKNELCRSGKLQSPINFLQDEFLVKDHTPFTLEWTDTILEAEFENEGVTGKV